MDEALNLFAGPGGSCEGAKAAGVATVGFEWDADACATATAAGHTRLQADVAEVEPTDWRWLPGLMGSPPCQSFSLAGKQLGKLDKPRLLRGLERIEERGRWIDYSRDGWHDPRSPLVMEPLRFIFANHPRWVFLEQVAPVLPLWQRYASILGGLGYSVDTGVLKAEQFGVPQTRKRAILVASLDQVAKLPTPTHRAFRKGVPRGDGDPTLLPWVSMADVLGDVDSLGFPRRNDRDTDAEYRERDWRDGAEPSFGLTEKARSWTLRSSAMANATVRAVDEPSPTITAGHDRNDRVGQHVARSATFGDRPGRSTDEPSFTITGSGSGGGGGAHHAPHWREETSSRPMLVEEAGMLQTFRADYPWQGSRTKQFEQVGNAVPPLLAEVIVKQLTH